MCLLTTHARSYVSSFRRGLVPMFKKNKLPKAFSGAHSSLPRATFLVRPGFVALYQGTGTRLSKGARASRLRGPARRLAIGAMHFSPLL